MSERNKPRKVKTLRVFLLPPLFIRANAVQNISAVFEPDRV